MNETPRKIVVGVDASAESDDALAWAKAVAGPSDRIVVVNAWDLPLVTGYETVVTVNPVEIEQLATQGLADIVERADDDRLVPVVRQGHPGRALVAEGEDADVIVVGHRGSGRASLVLGSTANYVLHHTRRPVVIVRGDHADAPRHVVVGADDHDMDDEHGAENEAVRALRWAYTVPGVEEIRVQHAWFLPALAIGMFSTAVTDFEEMDAAALAVSNRVIAAAGEPPAGVKVVAESVRGTPGFALIEASRDVDLIVVGSRGRGGFKGLVLGSTSAEVASHSHAPVAVVR